MRYVEMILSVDDASIIKFPKLVDTVKQWTMSGVRFIRLVTDTVKPDYIIHFSGSSNDPLNSNAPSFNDLYEKIKEPDAQKVGILKALYNHVSPDIILTIINNPLQSKNEYLHNLLESSNGYLIYKHQFEQFIMDKLGLSQQAAIAFTQEWNKKSIRNREPLIQSEHYFLIESRMPQYFVFDKPANEIL